jgi:hypothetical protein
VGVTAPPALQLRCEIALERGAECSYCFGMDESETSLTAPAGWIEALMRSKAQLEAGLTVTGESVRARLLDSIGRLEAGEAGASQPRATSRR